MRRIASTALAAALLVVAAPRAHAQGGSPLSIQAQGGLAFPTTSELKDNFEVGYTLGVTGRFRVMPAFSVYAGWELADFTAKEDAVGELADDATVRDNGFRGGAQLGLPLGLSGTTPYVMGGATYTRLENRVDSDRTGTTDWALGYELGGGVQIPLSSNLTMNPEVRYRNTKPKFEGFTSDASYGYVNATFGLAYHF